MLNRLQILTLIFSFLIGLEAKIKEDGPWTGYDDYAANYWIDNGIPLFDYRKNAF